MSTQQSGPSVITSPTSDTRTLNHRGTEVGSSNVTRSQNTTGSLTEVLKWDIPKKFKRMVLAGGKHWTKGEFRGLETFSGDGATTTFTLTADIVSIAGETTVADQPFPVAVVYDTAASSQHTIASVDYVANSITLDSAPSTGTDNVKVWYVISEGIVQYRVEDGFGNLVGPVDEWGVPIHVFADFNQEKNSTQIHLPGAARMRRDEALALYVDSARQVVWTDTDYPEGTYVSRVEQRVDVEI